MVDAEKKCLKCEEIKPLTDFYKDKSRKDGHFPWCKVCKAKNAQVWCAANKEKIRAYTREWKAANFEKCKAYNREWRAANSEKVKKHGRRAMQKYYSTPKRRLSRNISTGIWQSLKNGSKNKTHWEVLVGYTVEQLKKHLEKQFELGMSWENYGEWHIDHKTPVSAFNFNCPEDEDFKRCWALKNLQPMWASENIRKRNKIKKPFQPSLSFTLKKKE